MWKHRRYGIFFTNLKWKRAISSDVRKPNNYWSDEQNQKLFLANLAKELNIKETSDWYNVTSEDIQELGGGGLLNYYRSRNKMLETLIPELKQKQWKRGKISHGFWEDQKNQKAFLEDLSKELNIKKPEDWYSVTKEQIEERGGHGLLALHDGFVFNIVMQNFKDFDWKIWKFEQIPSGFWVVKKNQRLFLDDFAKSKGITSFEDWYLVKGNDIIEYGGSSLLKHHGNSFMRAIIRNYPEYKWEDWKFSHVEGTWDNKENRKAFFEWLGQKLNFKNHEDWYKLRQCDLVENGGGGLLKFYDNSHIKAVMDIMPEYQWKTWLFEKASQGYWKDQKNQRNFLDLMFKELHLKTWEDWYSVKAIDFVAKGGRGIIEYYNYSHSQAIMAIYPEYPWIVWKFNAVPKGFWNNSKNLENFVKWVAEQLHITNLDDWYSVTSAQIFALGGQGVVDAAGGIIPLLKKVYPDHDWKIDEHIKVGKKAQRVLFSYINDLFPSVSDIHNNFSHPELFFSESGKHMELDIYIPSLKLAFEYQGGQHVIENESKKIYLDENLKKRDEEKKKACEKMGITLIEIPHWWDQSINTLATMIQQSISGKYKLIYSKNKFIENKEMSSTTNSPSDNNSNGGANNDGNGDGNNNNGGGNNDNNNPLPDSLDLSKVYYLAKGSKGGSVPKCRGCQRLFKNREELRIMTHISFTVGSSRHFGKACFCLNSECVDRAIRNDQRKRAAVIYPPFDFKIYVPQNITDDVNKIPKQDLQFVLLSKNF